MIITVKAVHRKQESEELIRLRKRNEELQVMLSDSFQGHLLKVVIPELEERVEELTNTNKALKALSEKQKETINAVSEALKHGGSR